MSNSAMSAPDDGTPKRGFYVLKTDGGISADQGDGARAAAIGVVLKDHKYRDVDQVSERIEARNHHEAEYRALIAGLELARRHGLEQIRVFTDSALVVNSVNGDWNVQPEDLKDLCAKAAVRLSEFRDARLAWVPREMNREADELASRALGR